MAPGGWQGWPNRLARVGGVLIGVARWLQAWL
jgi:hypothetical protein